MLRSIILSIVVGITIISLGFVSAKLSYGYQGIHVTFNELPRETKKQITCLADNIFFEAAYEPDKGKKAVAFVTLNRMYSGYYPDTICEVVKQKTTHVCQFSWYCEDRPKRLSYTKQLTDRQQMVYNDIMKIALHVYMNYEILPDPTKGALFYHADYVDPKWKNMIRTAVIGRHIFYIRKDMV